ncbi:DUF4097 family beta strand repeat-containing protein [Amycolatopsis keratiniphila]|uniref:DUF4097 domain-containing protein n=1 Tax=Amycolatopsis keratiniphila subsp. keratiniphila TaxID=227715 RepID=A0A1W2LWE7_9PSEU|nr:DUF4097 family beta strand repeat-containing protein [Amycolatopsis keratiniphila]OLZ57783.1 hypothetical protein BS330_13460 [Amycolatopsis keratiniphila subsp. nogabecina]ONF70781.1 hypothetical protein AVR91_0214260 [Amycolatopsis keratiniphila subsp. keratiniphila]SDU02537.1 Putative adhesin [Amycolatopsis keratiniphila]
MPSFATPEPILADLDPVVGNVRIVAGDRADTVVEVAPLDKDNESDVDAAERTVVEFSGGTLTVRAPKMRLLDFSRRTRSIDVTIELPAGSRVQGSTGLGDLTATGRIGACRYKSGTGHIRLDRAGELKLHTASGNIVVEHADGNADISTSSGRVHVGAIDGTAVVKNSNGPTTIGAATGSIRLRSANGDITVDKAENGVEAKTANGSVRVLDAVRGTLTLETSLGDVEIGIREGSAAWLDVNTGFGRVVNDMTAATAPGETTDKVEVHAGTSVGDILVHRS